METVYELLKMSGVGLIAGVFSAYLANKTHRNQKWWELRVASYQDAIEALSDLVYYFDKNYDAHIENRDHSDELKEKLRKYWNESYHRIRKAADSGSFLFSKEVNIALREFIDTNKERPETYFEYLDNNLFVANKCLKAITKAAKTDLKL